MSAPDPPVRPTRGRAPRIRPLWWLAAFAVLAPLAHGPLRLRVRGRRHLPRRGALLVVSNHLSDRDPPLLGVAVAPRRLYYMAKTELFRRPLVARFLHSQGAFPVTRGGADRGAIRTAREILARGDALLMFPEGTRSPAGRLGRGWPGAGRLALEPGVTTVPVAIWGSARGLGPVRVAVGPALDLSDLAAGGRGERSQAAADRMMEAIAGLLPAAGGPALSPPSPRATPPPGPVAADAGVDG